MEERSGVAIMLAEKSFINATTNSILSKKKVLQPTLIEEEIIAKCFGGYDQIMIHKYKTISFFIAVNKCILILAKRSSCKHQNSYVEMGCDFTKPLR